MLNSYCDVKASECQWLWADRIPFGTPTIIAAAGGSGKGLTCVMLAIYVSRGESLDGARVSPAQSSWSRPKMTPATTLPTVLRLLGPRSPTSTPSAKLTTTPRRLRCRSHRRLALDH